MGDDGSTPYIFLARVDMSWFGELALDVVVVVVVVAVLVVVAAMGWWCPCWGGSSQFSHSLRELL